MGNLTSTLTVRLTDDVSGPAGKAAGALHKLGASGNDLKKLGAGSPDLARLIKQLDGLKDAAAKIEAFKRASRDLGVTGTAFRAARQEVSQLSAALAQAKLKADALKGIKGKSEERDAAAAEVRRLERALRSANGVLTSSKATFVEQGRAVRSLRSELTSAGVPLNNLRKAEADLSREMVRVNTALTRQPALIGASASKTTTLARAHTDLARGMGAVGRQQSALLARQGAADAAGRRMIDRMGAPAREAAARAAAAPGERAAAREAANARARGGLARGMGEAGRLQAEETARREAGAASDRRLIDGMNAPARAAAARRAEAEAERVRGAEERARVAAERRAVLSADRRDAAGTIASTSTLVAAHKGKQIGIEAIEAAGDFDYDVRQQHIATDVTEADQRSLLIPQAKRIGQETKFTNRDVVKAQTATMQGLPFRDPRQKAGAGAAIVDQARNYAVIMESDMARASEGIRSFLQNTGKDISTTEKASAEATRATNLIVKMSKLGGMSDEDVQQFIKYGMPTGTQVGLSDTTMAALGSTGRRAGLRGDELGVFARSAASKLVAPTSKGLDALQVAGIDYNQYTKMPGGLSADNLEGFAKRRFGKGFNDDQRGRLKDLLEDSSVVGSRDEFTKQVSDIVSESFDKKKDGNLKAADAQKIAKMVGDFHKLSAESVDSEGLLDAILKNPKMTTALRNAFFTDKHGGKAGMLAQNAEQLDRDREDLREVGNNPNFSRDKAKYKADGVGGAIDNFKGSLETLILNIGTANKDLIKGAADKTAGVADAVANLPDKAIQAGTALTAVAAAGGTAASTLAIMGKLTGSTALTALGAGAGAAMLPVLGAGAAGAALYGLSDESKGLVHGGRPDITMNPGDELPGLDGSNDKPSWVPAAPIAPNRPSLADGVPSPIDAPMKDKAASIEQARTALAGLRQELAGIKSEMAGQSGLGLAGLGQGLEAKKAEVEAAISGIEAKLKALGGETVAPKVDASSIESIGTAAEAAQGKVTALSGATAAPKGDASGLLALESVVDRIAGKIAALGGSIASAKAAAASVSVPSAAAGKQASTGAVRKAMANNFA